MRGLPTFLPTASRGTIIWQNILDTYYVDARYAHGAPWMEDGVKYDWQWFSLDGPPLSLWS